MLMWIKNSKYKMAKLIKPEDYIYSKPFISTAYLYNKKSNT